MDHVVEEVLIGAPIQLVWQAIVEDGPRKAWWPQMQLDASAEGGFIERWATPSGVRRVTRGRVMDIEPRRLLRLSWADDDWDQETTVTIELSERTSGAPLTAVTVLHGGWDVLDGGPELAASHAVGWRDHLGNLRDYVERMGPR